MSVPGGAALEVGSRASARLERWAPLIGLVLGVLLAHYAVLFSGFRLVQGEYGDTRFAIYLLEHSYRWLLRVPGHEHFWSPPFFFPAQGVEAYAENMVGTAPLYWIWRPFGAQPDTAFQLWMLSLSVLNYLSSYALLRRGFGRSALGSAAGAFLFAFASSRISQASHQQLLPHFFTPFAVFALTRVLGAEASAPERRRLRRLWILVFFIASAGQLLASIYLGWFLMLALVLAGIWGLALPKPRAALVELLRREPLAIGLGVALFAALVGPVLWQYLLATRQVGQRDLAEVMGMVPRLRSWLYLGPNSVPYGWSAPFFSELPNNYEHRIGLGIVTPAVAFLGLVRERHRPVGLLLLALAVTIFFFATAVGPFVPWRAIYFGMPGAKAIRAVARVALLLLVPLSFGLASMVDSLMSWRRWVVAPLLLVVGLEQAQRPDEFDKREQRARISAIANAVGPHCRAFFYTCTPAWDRPGATVYQMDGMMASLENGRAVVNGYSGSFPAGWELWENSPTSEELDGLKARFKQWVEANQLDPQTTCWVQLPGPNTPDAEFVAQSVPSRMQAGARYSVSVTVRNSGAMDWTGAMDWANAPFRLGASAPGSKKNWGLNRIPLANPVPRGSAATFNFEVQAPERPGTYPFQWQMVLEQVRWFGAETPRLEVVVEPREGALDATR